MCEWSEDALFEKAKIYMDRGYQEEDRNGQWFGLWAALTLEFLGRAAVSRKHPALLAHPHQPEAILFACQVSRPKAPRSVGAKTVFRRCQIIIPEFTSDDFDLCMSLVGRRNQEIHSGALGFDGFDTSLWLGKYYRTVKCLLDYLDKDFGDLLPGDEAQAAMKMVEEVTKDLQGEAYRLKNQAEIVFKKLDEVEIESKQQAAQLSYRKAKYSTTSTLRTCIVCSCDALIDGEVVSRGTPRITSGDILTTIQVLPTRFECPVCGLKLNSYHQLELLGLGGQFETEAWEDPLDFHDIDLEHYAEEHGYIHPREHFWEPEYDNE